MVENGRKGQFEIEYNHLPLEAKQSSPVIRPSVLVGQEKPSTLSGFPTGMTVLLNPLGRAIRHSLLAVSHNQDNSRAISSFEPHQCPASASQGAVLSYPMRQKFREVTEGVGYRPW